MKNLIMKFRDPNLMLISEKIASDTRLSFEDGLDLMNTSDLLGIGKLANYVKSKLHGEQVYFVVNQYINPTNKCVLACEFCDFAKQKNDPDSYEFTNLEILESISDDIREVHIVGGHHPDWTFEHYENMISLIHQYKPNVQIKAFTAAEIDYFWRRWKISPQESLERFKNAGLCMMPGGGAEILNDRVWKKLFPGKSSPDRWLEIHKIAHELGIYSNATILYGHIETVEERVEHLIKLRELQDDTSGFITFIPLAYQVSKNRLRDRQTSAIDDLKMIATARLMLDNFPHIEAFWVDLGVPCSSIALNFGASDINGTLVEERIAHAASAESPKGVTKEDIIQVIHDAKKIPVERNALYKVINTFPLMTRTTPISNEASE